MYQKINNADHYESNFKSHEESSPFYSTPYQSAQNIGPKALRNIYDPFSHLISHVCTSKRTDKPHIYLRGDIHEVKTTIFFFGHSCVEAVLPRIECLASIIPQAIGDRLITDFTNQRWTSYESCLWFTGGCVWNRMCDDSSFKFSWRYFKCA